MGIFLKMSVNANSIALAHVIKYAQKLIFDDSDDDEEDETEKIWDFAEETVPLFSDEQFRQSFRMSARTFENLLHLLHSMEVNYVHSGHPEVTLEKQLMITIWYLANLESFR